MHPTIFQQETLDVGDHGQFLLHVGDVRAPGQVAIDYDPQKAVGLLISDSMAVDFNYVRAHRLAREGNK